MVSFRRLVPALAISLVTAAAAVPAAGAAAAGPERADPQTAALLTPVTRELAERAAQLTLGRAFPSFGFPSEWRLRCAKRLLPTKWDCAVDWGVGDMSYRGNVLVRFVGSVPALRWVGRYTIKRLDGYCRYVENRPRRKCSDTLRGRGRGAL